MGTAADSSSVHAIDGRLGSIGGDELCQFFEEQVIGVPLEMIVIVGLEIVDGRSLDESA